MVMPVYNERDTIEEMIARVVAVPGIRMELIVVDDGSKDGTSDVLRELQKTHGSSCFTRRTAARDRRCGWASSR